MGQVGPIGRIFIKFDILQNSVVRIEVDDNQTRTTGTLHEDPCIYFYTLERENFQSNAVEKIKTYVLCSIFFPSENHAVYKIMWKML
jgi:hypothetical protein